MNTYVKVIYDEERYPKTDYTYLLCEHILQHYHILPGAKLMEVGCGRGDQLNHFEDLGLEVFGVDLSADDHSARNGITVVSCDLERDSIPYDSNFFDVVYSKSFIEHLYNPENYFKEVYRILKPGGLFISFVPDWESNYKTYFDDYTHRTPYTQVSLYDRYRIFKFEAVKVEIFRQLPLVWKYPSLKYLCQIISPFVPVRTKIKCLRWSRELMLAGVGKKPLG